MGHQASAISRACRPAIHVTHKHGASMVCLEHVGGLEKTEQDDSQSGLVDELGWSDSPFRSTVRSAHTHKHKHTLEAYCRYLVTWCVALSRLTCCRLRGVAVPKGVSLLGKAKAGLWTGPDGASCIFLPGSRPTARRSHSHAQSLS